MNIWGDLPPVTITPRVSAQAAVTPKSADVYRFLQDIGSNPAALNTLKMEQGKLKPMFKDFNPEQITPAALDEVGKKLYSFGLIDNLTADLLGRAALEFEKDGAPKNRDQEINAMEFFANQVDSMKSKSYNGDKYAKLLLPDYIRAVHVMMCLQDFGSKGEGFDSIARTRREERGEIPRQKAMKPMSLDGKFS